MKKKFIIYPIVYAALIGLFLLGTFLDFDISKTIADVESGQYFSNNFLANLVESFGEIPIFFMLGASICVIGYTLEDKFEKYRWVVLIVTYLLVFIVYTLCFSRCVESLGEVYGFTDKLEYGLGDEICAVLFGIAMVVVSIFVCNLLGADKLEKFFYFAIAVVCVLAITFCVTQLLKSIFSRPRFRALSYMQRFDKYSPWYKISNVNTQGFEELLKDDGFVSFPSGHASWACASALLCFLPKFLKLGKKTTLFLTIIPPIFIAIVAFARILAGAHYLTDVIFSIIISFIVQEIAVFVLLKIKSKREINVD